MTPIRLLSFAFVLSTALLLGCGGPSTPAQQEPLFQVGDEDRYYEEGLSARRAGDRQVAIDSFTLSTQANPRYLAAWLALGSIHQEAEEWPQAHAAYERATTIRARSADAQVGLARAALELGDTATAASAARLATVHAEDSGLEDVVGEAQRILGAALTADREYEDAVDAYEIALEADPTNLRTRIELAGLYDIVDRRPDSVRLLATAAMTAETSEELVTVGRILIEMGVAARALEPLQRAYTSGIDTDDVLLLLARANLDAGNRDVAIQQAGELIARSPNRAEAFLVRGNAQLLRVRSSTSYTAEAMERVMRDARAGLALEPENPAFHVLMGDAWATQAEREEALTAYRQALAYSPTEIAALEGLVLMANPANESEAASLIELLAPLSSTVERRPSWLAQLARAKRTLGDLESAALNMSAAANLADDEDLFHLEAAEFGLQAEDALSSEEILEHARLAFTIGGINSGRHRIAVIDALVADGQQQEALRFVQDSLRYLPAEPGLLERREQLDPRRRRR